MTARPAEAASTTTPAPLLRIERITKSFGNVDALRDIDFTIGRGEFFSLLGASGCGKTTLLRILAGIEQPTTGRLVIDGQDMAGVPANRRPTNMVFQSYAIFPHLNVEENIGYGLKNLKLGKEETARRIEEALALVKLDGFAKRNSHALSGGQRQRVALARALVMRPKVLLLDEPLSALDKKLREEMQLELRAMQRTLGITFVFVTHDQEEAMTLSDRIAIVSAGRILQIGSPQDLYERPAGREVAEFLGSMNLLPVTVSGPASVDAGPLGPLSAPVKGLPDGTPAQLALRPERLSLVEGEGPAGNRLSGAVAEAVYLGDRIHYLVDIPGLARPLRVVAPNSVAPVLALGSPVAVTWPDEAGLVLGD
ncbi:ABC transporter ATP-binding protein [Pseudoroseicyclus tamaricis]|uniref:ABC transporter ATP-binding protein n=1 Tax=Pseudoroseicyclus tamaricis TaxID=2705421 RepID=A0A6B2JLH7_9RHOB|nr:ABC transporter ATP-binding protein [Pseudoroseicyclus tamaricis]NDV02411.1 ABC transporter ATP-binding protein [Pseudoroseicyclus tamaricis]